MRYTQKHIDQMLSLIRKDDVSVELIQEPPLVSKSSPHNFHPRITLGIKGMKHLILLALCHEYGHVLSVRSGKGLKRSTAMFYAMNIIRSKRDGKAILAEERRAFRLGFKVLRDNGILIDEDMKYARDVLIASHIKLVRKLLKEK
jgi:hypothetical protein